MPLRNCPVCRIGKIRRRDIKTCGAPDCVELWRAMTSTQRAKAVEEADNESISYVTLPSPTFDKPTVYQHSPEAPDSTTKRDNEALKRIFGEDNPPGSVPDDENEVNDPNSPKKA